MTKEEIITLIIQSVPAIIAFCTAIGTILKTVKEFAALRKEVADMKSVEEVRNDLKKVIDENYELKKTLNEAMTKIDHVERNKK